MKEARATKAPTSRSERIGQRSLLLILLDDLPAMLLAVSRLTFAWAEDGIFPSGIAAVHPRFHTPHRALVLSGSIASLGVLGSHFAGDFFLGIDIMVTAMTVNFLLMCLTLLTLPRVNPALASQNRQKLTHEWHNPILRCSILPLISVWLLCSNDRFGGHLSCIIRCRAI